jgi:hypothetical protein
MEYLIILLVFILGCVIAILGFAYAVFGPFWKRGGWK